MAAGGGRGLSGQARPPHSESLLSELDPLELLLADSEELLLLSREGPPGSAAPDFSGGDAAGERLFPRPWIAPHPDALHHAITPAAFAAHPVSHPLHTPRPTHASARSRDERVHVSVEEEGALTRLRVMRRLWVCPETPERPEGKNVLLFVRSFGSPRVYTNECLAEAPRLPQDGAGHLEDQACRRRELGAPPHVGGGGKHMELGGWPPKGRGSAWSPPLAVTPGSHPVSRRSPEFHEPCST